MSPAAERLAALRARIAAAASRAGRRPAEVTLLGVAKRIPSERVAEALAAGLADVGESYLQEAIGRRDALARRIERDGLAPPRWHFIGRLQRNKARAVARHFDVVHTLDRAELGDALERGAAETGRRVELLIQVNTSGEAQKAGLPVAGVAELAARTAGWPHLRLVGLMTLPAQADDPERVRPAFAALRALRDRLRPNHPALSELSMGMSGDFEVAVEEGATIIRVGTALFGARAEQNED